MKTKYFPLLLFFITALTSFSQKKKDVLLTINNQPVYASEFITVFKKNLDLVKDESQKSVDGYLDLFVDYKLKVTEAYAQGLDKNESYIKEFSKYQDQLSKSYIYDKRITSELIAEAYERGLEEIDATHILIKVNFNAKPEDTLVAYNKIKSIREKALRDDNFESLAKKYSEEPGVDETGGKLGYFSVFKMVYPFETTAYNTKVGEISEITRTQFGYHILKINDRRKKMPKINVSHIMIYSNQKAKIENPEERINELYAMIKQGESFEFIAKQFSEDKATGINGGKLTTFGPGDLRAPAFEEAAYKLSEIGELSKPIKSSFGWHILKLNEKFKVPTFKEQKAELESKVNGGTRANVVTQAVNSKIKAKYGFKQGESILPYFNDYVTDSIFVKKWIYTPIPRDQDKLLFSIGDQEVHYNDFAKFIEKKQKSSRNYKEKESMLIDFYNEFTNNTIEDYFKNNLEKENEEYAATINEYRYGLLIFDVMEKNIWAVAKNDSIGLQRYYEETKSDYIWKKRVDVDIISAISKSMAVQVQKLLNEGMNMQELRKQLNIDDRINVIITKGLFEVDQPELPENFEVKEGVSEIYNRENSNIVINVKEILEPSTKELNDVMGLVVSKYQTQIEEKWMEELLDKYTVVINKKTLKKVKKQLDH